MRNLNIAIRSLFKKGRHNVMKIISLSVGLSVALVMIAKIFLNNLTIPSIRMRTGFTGSMRIIA